MYIYIYKQRDEDMSEMGRRWGFNVFVGSGRPRRTESNMSWLMTDTNHDVLEKKIILIISSSAKSRFGILKRFEGSGEAGTFALVDAW